MARKKTEPKGIEVTAQTGITAVESPLIQGVEMTTVNPGAIVRQEEEAPAKIDIVEIDGMFYNGDTGEFIGIAGKNEPFVIDDLAKAEWVMGKIQMTEAELAAVDYHPAVLAANATLAWAETKKAQHATRLKGLHAWFGPQLVHWAKDHFPKGKKSLTTVLGSIGEESEEAKYKVADADLALAWAKSYCPPAVVVKPAVESFGISKVPKETKVAILKLLELGPSEVDKLDPADPQTIAFKAMLKAFKYEPATTKPVIKTSVAVKKEVVAK